MPDGIYLMGILVEERTVHGPEVQEVLTRYGSVILNRSGIPDPSRKRGLISVTFQADEADAAKFHQDLLRIQGVRAQAVRLGDALM